MDKVHCPSCGEASWADTQGIRDAGETTVLRGKNEQETPEERATLRRTKYVNVICPNCGFEFLESVEDQDAN